MKIWIQLQGHNEIGKISNELIAEWLDNEFDLMNEFDELIFEW